MSIKIHEFMSATLGLHDWLLKNAAQSVALSVSEGTAATPRHQLLFLSKMRTPPEPSHVSRSLPGPEQGCHHGADRV